MGWLRRPRLDSAGGKGEEDAGELAVVFNPPGEASTGGYSTAAVSSDHGQVARAEGEDREPVS